MERHFTATAYIFSGNKTLLHFHKKLQCWLPPGGHVEPNETPPEAARREASEETGLEIEFIRQENLTVNAYNGVSFERPFLCLLENIPAYKEVPAHQHMDMIYLARVVGDKEPVGGFRWFTYEELPHDHLLPDVKAVLELVLKDQQTTNDGVVFQ